MKQAFDIFQEKNLFNDYNFENALYHFLENRLYPFSLREILLALGKKDSVENRNQLSDFLIINCIAFCSKISENEDLWLSRAGLFTEREFSVTPTKMELASGIFIPGSRCIPFANPRHLPSQFQFFHKGRKLDTILVDTTEAEICPYYILYGEEFTPQYLAMDNPESKEIFKDFDFFMEEQNDFPVTVVDMRDFYWKNEVHFGDALIFKVKNWSASVFSVSVRHKKDTDEEGLKKWRNVFEAALALSFQTDGPAASIEEQITTAFFIGGQKLFDFPPDDISTTIAESKKIELSPYGAETRLWQKGLPFPVPGNWNQWLQGTTGINNTRLFHQTGIPVCPEILNAYILDALYRQEKTPDALVSRIEKLATCNPREFPKQQIIQHIVSSEFYAQKNIYNWFADRFSAKYRGRLINLFSRIITFVHSIQKSGISPKDIPDQDVIMMGQLTSHVVTCLESFYHNPQDSEMIPEESMEGMEDTFDELEISIKNVAGDVRRKK